MFRVSISLMPSTYWKYSSSSLTMKPFHLVGAHADVIEEDVDLGDVERREDIHPHPVEAQQAAADQGHDQHQGRDRAPHREGGRIHEASLKRTHSSLRIGNQGNFNG